MSADAFDEPLGLAEDTEEEEDYDPEEDAMPTLHVVIRREIKEPHHVIIEATIGEDSTFIKFWQDSYPERFHYCFLDTLEPDMVLNTLENKFRKGLFYGVEDFFIKYGRDISDEVRFRLKLDAVVK